jgi:hypothetical protein
VDWGLVETGHVGWMGRKGDVVPLGGAHDYTDQKDIFPVPFSVASGVVIRTEPARFWGRQNQLIPPTLPWEGEGVEIRTLLWDEAESLYRVWYDTRAGLGYAFSKDLKNWQKPLVSSVEWESSAKTNICYLRNPDDVKRGMFQHPGEVRAGRHNSIFIDPRAPAAERFKTTFVASTRVEELRAFAARKGKPLSPMVSPSSGNTLFGQYSADGVGWTVIPEPILLHDADTLSVFGWDPVFERYFTYTRLFELGRRTVGYAESADFRDFPLPWSALAPGPTDPPYVDYYANSHTFYPGHPDLRLIFLMVYDRSLDKSEIRLAVSRNGKLWSQVPGGPIIAPGTTGDWTRPDAWDASFVHTAPHLVRAPDGQMLLPMGGNRMPHKFPRRALQSGANAVAAWLEDRLAGLEAAERGEFTTPFLKLNARKILLNLRTERAGFIQVQLHDQTFAPVAGHTFAQSDPLTGDDLSLPVTWNGRGDVSALRGQLVYLRFRLRAAKLFAIQGG